MLVEHGKCLYPAVVSLVASYKLLVLFSIFALFLFVYFGKYGPDDGSIYMYIHGENITKLVGCI